MSSRVPHVSRPVARALIALGVVAAGVLVATRVLADDAPVPHRAAVFHYGPGLRADLFLPDPLPAAAPLVVLVPGGGWTSADPAGLRPLADRLAAAGIVAVTATYRVGRDDARFPVPVADIGCSVDAAAARAREAGVRPGPVVLLGHSAGAQLAVVAALTGTRFRAGVPACGPVTPVDGFVGLAGPYDITRLADLAEPLVGATPGEDPAAWRAADPLTWTGARPGLPALLAAGTADDLVSPWFTDTFAEALRRGGHPVQVLKVDGATHATIYHAGVIADAVIGWVRSLR